MAVVRIGAARAAAAALVVLGVLAGCAERAVGPGAAAAAPPRPALWRVADADSTVWLFGTVHVLPKDLVWRDARVEAAFDGADVIYFETRTDAAAGAAIRDFLAAQPQTPRLPLSQLLAPEAAARLGRVSAALSLNRAALEATPAWLAALQLSLAYVRVQGHDPAAGVEAVLEARAAEKGLAVRYFEDPASQIAIMAGLPEADQVRFLAATLRQIEEEGETVAAMDAAWAAGRLAPLEGILMAQFQEAGPAAYEALLTKRNTAWAAEIDALLRGQGEAFVAVGAAHLLGPDSVQTLLEAKGWKVERR